MGSTAKILKLALLLVSFSLAESQLLSYTPTELRQYDGTEATPIYLAINGSIYDVSSSRTFYGPGGSYHHFAGRDASRAWVTECWDSEDQLTWRMDGVEEMFMARYLDEELEKVASGGDLDLDIGGIIGREQMEMMAKAALARLGKVSTKEKAGRRKEDKAEADQKVHETLKHWIDFFENNPKYEVVGNMVLDEGPTPFPPALCEQAKQKRPLKGGKLDNLMNVADMGRKSGEESNSGMPDFLKARHKQQVDEESNKQTKDEL